jgi:hypothetical protein
MIERKTNRRKGASSYFTSPENDRRRLSYERRVGGEPAAPGVIRPGVGEAKPPVERRRYLDGGME